MKGIVSFHPVDLSFFDDVIAPLCAGKKINPEPYLLACLRIRSNAWTARRYVHALRDLLARAEPSKPDPGAKLWDRVRSQLERMEHRPDPALARLAQAIESDVLFDGRPFFVVDGAAERVAEVVEAFRVAATDAEADRLARQQLARLDAETAKTLEGIDGPPLSSDLTYRQDLLGSLAQVFEIARAARDGKTWAAPGAAAVPGEEAVAWSLPWRAVEAHARHLPFWIARDVDGLETICRASGVAAPDGLVPPWRLFAETCERHPALREALHLEISGPRDLGALVLPGEVPDLLDFLGLNGARIIQAAVRAGEGPAATTLLRKIRECATYAQKRGFGYLEASGIVPPERLDETAAE